MIDSGVAYVGKLGASAEISISWGKSEKDSLFYDLASLTKVVVTNTLLLEFCSDAKKSIEEFKQMQAGAFLPQAPEAIQKLNLGQLWEHRAGLKDHIFLDPLKSRSPFKGSREALWSYIFGQIEKEGLESVPEGETLYSDLSYWILGSLLETFYKKDLKTLWQDCKKKYALPLNDLLYGPLSSLSLNTKAVPTETRHAIGIVNDDNALFMQEVAPHAGLFSTAEALWEWMNLMSEWREIRPELAYYFEPQHEERFWCGWDRPTGEKSLAGQGADPNHVLGHLGFTGTALWWNPLTKWGGLLLTNRVYPSSDQNQSEIRDLRMKIFSLLWHNKRKELWEQIQQTLRK